MSKSTPYEVWYADSKSGKRQVLPGSFSEEEAGEKIDQLRAAGNRHVQKVRIRHAKQRFGRALAAVA